MRDLVRHLKALIDAELASEDPWGETADGEEIELEFQEEDA